MRPVGIQLGLLKLVRDGGAGTANCAGLLMGVPGLAGGLSVPSSDEAKRTDDVVRPLPLAESSGESIIDSTDAIDALRRGPASGDGPCTSRPFVGTDAAISRDRRRSPLVDRCGSSAVETVPTLVAALGM